MIKTLRIFSVCLLGVAFLEPAYAYVDPGIVSTLFQGLFALVAGLITAWTTGAFGLIKGLFKKRHLPDGAKTESPSLDAALTQPSDTEDASR